MSSGPVGNDGHGGRGGPAELGGGALHGGPETARDAARPSSQSLVFRTLDRALALAVADEPRLIRARDEWNRLAGKINDDEPLYEQRVAAFLEWYTLEHRGAVTATPETSAAMSTDPSAAMSADPSTDPSTATTTATSTDTTTATTIERLLAAPPIESAGRELSPTRLETAALVALASSHRSIFRVRELVPEGLLLDNLWGGGSFRIKERRQLAGVERGELFDARLVADVDAPPDLLLTRILCVHPREVEETVREQIVRARKEGRRREDFLFLLLRLRVRCERYQHVSPVRIYAAGETTR